jgi:hypothetical protein
VHLETRKVDIYVDMAPKCERKPMKMSASKQSKHSARYIHEWRYIVWKMVLKI